MNQVVIENPVINSPFAEPKRHFRFTDEGITNEVIDGRRSSSYFVPIARPRKKGQKQLEFDTEWTQDRIEENKLVNRIRARVQLWREGGRIGVTPMTSRLLAYWTDPDREKKLFFCQIEALETAIYFTEVAHKYGDTWIANDLRDANDSSNPGLPRVAFKMATGSGKTVVMGMFIAWHTLNKLANPQDARFSDTFLIVTPGITIRDRLRVLLPNDPQNYYRQRDVLSSESLEQLGRAKILITNFHTLQLREKVAAGKLTKAILAEGGTSAFTETPDQMVRRVCRELGTKKNIVILNDEAHHCYRRKPDGEDVKLKGDERKEAKQRDEEARVWISGLEAIKAKIGVKVIYDLSATPFFLRGSGYPEGTLFPWVVSDFSLIDAIEDGIVKVPRIPVADTDSWEQKLAQTLEDMDEVVRYVKNHNLGFAIPYTINGEAKNYVPDFIACIDDGHGPDDLLNLLIEVTGEKKKDKAAKVATARTLWVPAVNNHGGFGRWDFIEIDDPWDAENRIRVYVSGSSATDEGTSA